MSTHLTGAAPAHADELDRTTEPTLRVIGTRHLYVCDMSVMPFSSAANPVRTLTALALRLGAHFDQH